MILDHNNKFIYIAVPKTASTTVHVAWGHPLDPPPPEYHMKLHECLEKNLGCEEYFKFCFVRNPYDRFVSTWFNLVDPKAGHAWAKPLLEEYHTFDNFCKNFATSEWQSWIHFRPQLDYCLVDDVNRMDFVGHQENFDIDFSEACRLIGVPRPATGRYRFSEHAHFKEYYDDDMKDIIYRFYQKDFEAFEYDK